MDGLRGYHTKRSESDRKRQVIYDIAYMQNLKKNGTNELIYKTEIESQMQKTNLWLPSRKRSEGERSKLGDCDGHIHTTSYKQITNKNLLYRTGSSTQYYVMTYMGKEF